LKNADGVAFKLTLNTLLARPEGNPKLVMLHAQKALGKTVRDGFATNVAQAVAYAFTIRANDNDYTNVLEVIMKRQLKLEKRKKGIGLRHRFVFTQSLRREWMSIREGPSVRCGRLCI